ncbi:MAG TPA: zinc ribbon domain-containing protein [Candidatus Deferrimicrobium sp.]|nr:zinc ribbon domain-containing protein [Candidatus Deferrimicrobium sp.]
MNYVKLLNITSPEEIGFNFPGKLGRIGLVWKEGQWIITNGRLIFVADDLFFGGREPFASHFQRPLALILFLNEIREVIKKETKIIVTYLPLSTRYHSSKRVELGIGFYERQYEDYQLKKSSLMEAIYAFLQNPDNLESKDLCPNCRTEIQQDDVFCPNCGLSFKPCEICKHPILKLEDQTICPYCNSIFHKNEFSKWVINHGRCPICDFEIPQDFKFIKNKDYNLKIY